MIRENYKLGVNVLVRAALSIIGAVFISLTICLTVLHMISAIQRMKNIQNLMQGTQISDSITIDLSEVAKNEKSNP